MERSGEVSAARPVGPYERAHGHPRPKRVPTSLGTSPRGASPDQHGRTPGDRRGAGRVAATTPQGQSQPGQSSPSPELDNSRALRKPSLGAYETAGPCPPGWAVQTGHRPRDKRTSRQSHGEAGTRAAPPPDQCAFTQVNSHFPDALSCPSPSPVFCPIN